MISSLVWVAQQPVEQNREELGTYLNRVEAWVETGRGREREEERKRHTETMLIEVVNDVIY